VHIWSEAIFLPGLTNIEALEAELLRADFAVLLLSPDDVVTSRGNTLDTPRDNVVFELGLFSGALGRRRAIMVYPQGSNLKIPTDLLGVNPIKYFGAEMTPVADELRTIFADLRGR
jgi:predicted nucleotide-binding protein